MNVGQTTTVFLVVSSFALAPSIRRSAVAGEDCRGKPPAAGFPQEEGLGGGVQGGRKHRNGSIAGRFKFTDVFHVSQGQLEFDRESEGNPSTSSYHEPVDSTSLEAIPSSIRFALSV